MTIEESLKRRLDVRLAKHGESDFSAQQLKAQLASLKHFKRVKLAEASQKFHLGARQGPPERPPNGPQGGHVRKRDTGRPGGESAGGGGGKEAAGGGELSFALKPGKFQGAATAKNATFRRKTPKHPAHARAGG